MADHLCQLRAMLQRRYGIECRDTHAALGDGYRGVKLGNTPRPVFLRIVPHADGFDGIVGQAERCVNHEHACVVAPREVFDCPEIGTVFVFDEPELATMTLRSFLKGLKQDPSEAVIAALFAPVALGLRSLEEAGQLPDRALVDASTVLAFPDGSVRVLSPFGNLHGAHDGHRHRQLERHGKKVGKKLAKVDKHDATALAAEQQQVHRRFLVADLGMLLYEIMFRSEAHKVSTKMIHDAKKLVKEGKRYSPELSHLLLELLENGKTEKHALITLQALIGRPVMQRFIAGLTADVRRNKELTKVEKHAFAVDTAAARNARVVYSTAKQIEYAKARRKMVAGKHHKLGGLVKTPIEKQCGIRFDIPYVTFAHWRKAEKKRFLRSKSKRSAPHTLEDYSKERKKMVAGKHHRLSNLLTSPVAKKNGIRFDIPLVEKPKRKHHFRRLMHRVGPLRKTSRRSPARMAAVYDKERAKMVKGKHHHLSQLKKKPIEKKNGIRFDIPLEDASVQKRRHFRKSKRHVARRTPEDYAKDRKKMVAGKHHRLSKLKKKPIERRAGVRFDIPIDKSYRRGKRAAWPMRRDFAAERRRLVTGEGHQLSGFIAAPIEKKRSTRFDIPLPLERRERLRNSVRQARPAEQQSKPRASRVRFGLPVTSTSSTSWFDTFERRRTWSSKRRAPAKLSKTELAEREKAFGRQVPLPKSRKLDERPIQAKPGLSKAWWEMNKLQAPAKPQKESARRSAKTVAPMRRTPDERNRAGIMG